MIRRVLGQREAQEAPQGKTICAPPSDAPLRPDPFEVADQQHPKVVARRDRRPATLRIIRLAKFLDPRIKPGFRQQLVELHVKHMAHRPRQLIVHDEQIILTLRLALPQRHRRTLHCRISAREAS